MILPTSVRMSIVRILTPMFHSYVLRDYNKWRHGEPKNDGLSLVESHARLSEVMEILSNEENSVQRNCLDSARNALKILLDGFEKTGKPVPCEVVAELEHIISALESSL